MAKAQTAAAIQHATFLWEGSDARGQKIKGETIASSEMLVKAELRRQGIRPTQVRRKAKPLFQTSKKITPKDISVFSRQLATMMTAGVPLVQGLDIIARGHENPGMQTLVGAIRNDVEAGGTLRDALARHPFQFDDLYCNLVGAGEHAGVLETLLHKIADYQERTEALKAKIRKAMFYPTAVIVVAFIVTAILLIFVVPQFEELFKNFGADLPAFTKLVIGLSRFMQDWWWAVFGAVGGGLWGFFQAKKRSPKLRVWMDRTVLKIPVVGVIMQKAAIARYARTLSTMFAAGVPLVEALTSVSGATGNQVYADAVLRIREQVATGQQLQLAMRQTGLFPNLVTQMVAIGEESGSLDSMLSKVADFHEEEVNNAVDALSSLIEPLIMAVLGVLIGGLVVAMYLPIFKLGAVV